MDKPLASSENSGWSSLYKISGVAAWIFVAYSLGTIIIFMFLLQMPETALEAFKALQENRIIGLLRLDALTLLTVPLYYLIYLCIYQGIKNADLLSKLIIIQASRADLKWIETVHEKKYIERFEAICRSGNSMFDYPDNQICAETFETALLAVGGVLDAAKLVNQVGLPGVWSVVTGIVSKDAPARLVRRLF